MPQLQIAQDPVADRVLSENPFALLVGMMLDQQFPMERAFAGPAKVLERFGSLDPAAVAQADPEEFAALCSTPPAVHRFPGSMAARMQELAAIVVERYDGRADRLWTEADTGQELLRRLQALPGFGKQLGVRPEGWEAAAGDYAEPGSHRSVADVVDAGSLEKVRSFKKQKKAAARG
jgi:uncharacterized HhH-GPD family protein